MPIPFRCPHCGNQTEVADQYAGQTGPCARCGKPVTVPAPGRGGRAAKKGGGGAVIAVIIVAVLLVLGLCAGGGIFVWSIGRRGAQVAQDQNSLRQIGLGLHNHHDTFRQFPTAGGGPEGMPIEGMPIEKQLSWMARLLPFVEQGALHDRLDFNQAWDSPANRTAAQTPISTFQSLVQPAPPGHTNFVGIGGIGPDGPKLPDNDPRAGCFGYNRRTGIGNIRDGTSNTMIVAETHKNTGPWAQNGPATVRALDPQAAPYIGGDGQFGTAAGANVLLADASVRMLQPDIDPKVVEALATSSGQEVVQIPSGRR